MRGAIREDDVPTLFGGNPADPYGSIFRVFNHFYDPRNDQGLTVGAFQGAKAPDWGIGASDAFADENAADAFRRNHFTVFDARESMFRALTGMSGSGSRAIGAGGSEPGTAADKLAVRKAYWATTFRALGDIVHLIQDMAQPQHTRNDPHAGSDNYEQPAGPGGHASFYESYIDQRATQTPVTESNGNTYTPAALVYDTSPSSYPIPRFNDYVSYFSTRNDDASVASRKGMADYSNRGFFSIGKNLGQGDYDLPPNSISGGFYTPEQRVVASNGTTVHLLKGSVSDANASTTETDVPLTTFGAWDDALQQANGQESFTLIRENYDAMANLLIPRAVAYSAGLIDYFFRGRMEITLPSEGVYSIVDHAAVNGIDEGFTKVKLKLRNITPAISDGQGSHAQTMGPGKLYAVAKYRRNPCYQPDLSGEHTFSGAIINGCSASPNPTANEEIVVSEAIDVQSINTTDPQPFSFDFTDPIPINATDLHLQVVFRGQLGSEADAVAVATKDISEPTFVEISNNSDYIVTNDVYEVNPNPWVIYGIGVAFNDSYYFVAQKNELAVATRAQLAILVDVSSSRVATTVYDYKGSGRFILPVNVNQMDLSGQQQTTPFNFCDLEYPFIQYRGVYILNGVTWRGESMSDCSQLESLEPFAVLQPQAVDKINF